MKIGILRENEKTNEKRVPITPVVAHSLLSDYRISIKIQPAKNRAFTDNEYRFAGIDVCEDLSDCNVIMGIKQPDASHLIAEKTYMFFAHVAKKQANNQKYFSQLSKNNITLIDYEYLTDTAGKRLISFGNIAGIIGTYYLIDMLTHRFDQNRLPSPTSFQSTLQLIQQLNKVVFPKCKILISGNGNVATGAINTLNTIGLQQVSPHEFITQSFEKPIFCNLKTSDYIVKKTDSGGYKSLFKKKQKTEVELNKYTQKADGYIAAHNWNPEYSVYLSVNDLLAKHSKLKCIADITCDINGSIESTRHETTFDAPYFDFNPQKNSIELPFSSNKNINVMAIGNLPSALPREASSDFANKLSQTVISKLIENPNDNLFTNATILNKGKLSEKFIYLNDYLLKE
jgi:alanine dehydrogenase